MARRLRGLPATYTTPAVELGTNGSTSIGSFEVTVSNSVNSMSSKSATLNVGPRSPKAGDLRYLLFQQVDAPWSPNLSGPGIVSGGASINYTSGSYNPAVGDPLGMGSSVDCGGGECTWPYGYQFLPTPMTGLAMYYQPGEYSSFKSDLQSYAATNVVITSLDLEPAESVYAVSWVQTSQTGGFDYRLDPLIPAGADQASQIQVEAALDGSESRVITAVSFDESGNAILISYGWSGDTTTLYEDQTYYVAPGSGVGANVLAAATTLASNGYIISAFGGNDTDGYILIGMRVEGDILPRPINGPATGEPPYATGVVDLRESGSATFVNEQ
jgi:hypothetical protein